MYREFHLFRLRPTATPPNGACIVQRRFIARQEMASARCSILNVVSLIDRKFGRFFTRDGRFVAHERRFDFRRADCNDVTACLA